MLPEPLTGRGMQPPATFRGLEALGPLQHLQACLTASPLALRVHELGLQVVPMPLDRVQLLLQTGGCLCCQMGSIPLLAELVTVTACFPVHGHGHGAR